MRNASSIFVKVKICISILIQITRGLCSRPCRISDVNINLFMFDGRQIKTEIAPREYAVL